MEDRAPPARGESERDQEKRPEGVIPDQLKRRWEIDVEWKRGGSVGMSSRGWVFIHLVDRMTGDGLKDVTREGRCQMCIKQRVLGRTKEPWASRACARRWG